MKPRIFAVVALLLVLSQHAHAAALNIEHSRRASPLRRAKVHQDDATLGIKSAHPPHSLLELTATAESQAKFAPFVVLGIGAVVVLVVIGWKIYGAVRQWNADARAVSQYEENQARLVCDARLQAYATSRQLEMQVQMVSGLVQAKHVCDGSDQLNTAAQCAASETQALSVEDALLHRVHEELERLGSITFADPAVEEARNSIVKTLQQFSALARSEAHRLQWLEWRARIFDDSMPRACPRSLDCKTLLDSFVRPLQQEVRDMVETAHQMALQCMSHPGFGLQFSSLYQRVRSTLGVVPAGNGGFSDVGQVAHDMFLSPTHLASVINGAAANLASADPSAERGSFKSTTIGFQLADFVASTFQSLVTSDDIIAAGPVAEVAVGALTAGVGIQWAVGAGVSMVLTVLDIGLSKLNKHHWETLAVNAHESTCNEMLQLYQLAQAQQRASTTMSGFLRAAFRSLPLGLRQLPPDLYASVLRAYLYDDVTSLESLPYAKLPAAHMMLAVLRSDDLPDRFRSRILSSPRFEHVSDAWIAMIDSASASQVSAIASIIEETRCPQLSIIDQMAFDSVVYDARTSGVGSDKMNALAMPVPSKLPVCSISAFVSGMAVAAGLLGGETSVKGLCADLSTRYKALYLANVPIATALSNTFKTKCNDEASTYINAIKNRIGDKGASKDVFAVLKEAVLADLRREIYEGGALGFQEAIAQYAARVFLDKPTGSSSMASVYQGWRLGWNMLHDPQLRELGDRDFKNGHMTPTSYAPVCQGGRLIPDFMRDWNRGLSGNAHRWLWDSLEAHVSISVGSDLLRDVTMAWARRAGASGSHGSSLSVPSLTSGTQVNEVVPLVEEVNEDEGELTEI